MGDIYADISHLCISKHFSKVISKFNVGASNARPYIYFA